MNTSADESGAGPLPVTAEELGKGIKTSWLLLCTFLVVSMQLGFAMIEVGSVREAHRMTVLAKNVMDSAMSCLVFAVVTGQNFWESSLVLDSSKDVMYPDLLYNWAFCATCVTICSGSMAERTHIIGYLTHAGLMAGLIFPPLAEAVWGSRGFLRPFFVNAVHQDVRYHDCAGSGVVHLVGGVAALAGNSLLGRRIMRTDDLPDLEASELQRLSAMDSPSAATAATGVPAVSPSAVAPQEDMEVQDVEHGDRVASSQSREPKINEETASMEAAARWQRRFDNAERDKAEFQPCNYLQVMGMFILWVGWYGFNTGGSLTTEPGGSHTAGLVAWNTTVAAAAGGFGSYLYLYGFRLNLDVGFLCNGLLSGLVSITACCDVSTPLVSMLIGLVAGLVVYPMASNGMRRLRLDDPVDAVPVHAASGLFGILVVGLCSPDCPVLQEKGLSQAQQMFCRQEHHIGRQLLAQLLGGTVIIAWTFFISYAFWLLLAAAECVRALELEQVSRAQNLLRQLTASGPLSKVHQELESAAQLSRTVRRALKEHGWVGNRFLKGQPQDLMSLLTKLQQAQFGSLETALETEVCAPLRILVRCCGSWRFCRELAIARLRIHPWAEISGLGAAETDGGKLYMALQRAAGQIAELRSQTHAEPLQTEVRELGMLVRSQDVLLRRLIARRYSNLSASRRLRLIPEQSSLRQESSEEPREASPSSPNCQVPQEDSTPDSQLSTARSLRSGLSSRPAWHDGGFPSLPPNFRLDLLSETASTVSDASLGALSPHSVASTPPPTIHGARSRGMRRSIEGQAPVMNVAEQLVRMLQMQQQLLSAIGAPPVQGSNAASSSQPMAQQATLLCQALQQVVDQAASPCSSRRSTTSFLDQ